MKQNHFCLVVLQFVLFFVKIESHTFYRTCTKTDGLDVEELSKIGFLNNEESFSKQEISINHFFEFNVVNEDWEYDNGSLGHGWARWDIDNDLYFLECPNGFIGSNSVTGDLNPLCYIKLNSVERPYLELEVVYQKKNSNDPCFDNFKDYEINEEPQENQNNNSEQTNNEGESTNNETPEETNNENENTNEETGNEDENTNQETDNENENTNEESGNENENTNEESGDESGNEDENTNDESSDESSDESYNEEENTNDESDDEEEPKISKAFKYISHHSWQCGKGIGKCSNGYCCSKYGWCGKTSNYCNKKRGCQSSYGFCW